MCLEHQVSVPWLGEVWTYITERERSINPWNKFESKGFAFLNQPHPTLPAAGFANLVFDCENVSSALCKSAADEISVQWFMSQGPSTPQERTAAHELAHAYTLSNDAPRNPLAVVAGYLYLQDLLESDPTWTPHKVFGAGFHCSAVEILADLGMYFVIEGRYSTSSLGYWTNCQPGGSGVPSDEAIALARDVFSGQVPQWFYDTYEKADGSYDLDTLWRDVRTVSGRSAAHSYFLMHALSVHFGGYCSDADAIRSDPRLGNPWRDGGCEQRTRSTGTQVAAGHSHSCAVKADETITCWGSNSNGEADAPAGTFTAAAAGTTHSCGLKTDGTITCWGSNSDAHLTWGGPGTTPEPAYAGQAEAPSGTFIAVAAGGYHSCGVKTDGTITCWGSNSAGQASTPAGNYTAVSAGRDHSCGLVTDGTIFCWGGYGAHSQAPAGTFTAVAAGGNHSCGIDTDGTVTCWGSNNAGQTTAPTETLKSVSAGGNHSCGIDIDGTVTCWGSNSAGQATAPTGTFTAIAAGESHSCGIDTDGTISCWGYDRHGQASPPGDSSN